MTVTQEQINALFDTAETREVVVFDKCLVVAYRFKNGFVLVESSACIDPKNFDIETGRKICREHAENKLWELEGYALQNTEYQKTVKHTDKDIQQRVDSLSPEAKDMYNTLLEVLKTKYPIKDSI